MNCLLFASIWV